MMVIMCIFASLFSFGIYMILAEKFKIPKYKTAKAVLYLARRRSKKASSLDVFILNISNNISALIRINDYKRKSMESALRAAKINLSPETYVAKAIVKSGLILLCIIPALLVLPILSPAILFLAIVFYFKEINRAQEEIMKQREEIEYELPRFTSTLVQELKASRDVLSILETYKKNAGSAIKRELEITVADMKSGNFEGALTRLETRIGSPALSDVVRGLISILRGDDGIVYFQMLSHDLKQLELQKLKAKAAKQPAKLRKYSLAMLLCFILVYLGVMAVEIVKTLGNLF
ncbi:UNVERIFIED_CONTAM: hypothetical protein Cloal_0219 [Acetivibrio alkalicellulosi]